LKKQTKLNPSSTINKTKTLTGKLSATETTSADQVHQLFQQQKVIENY